MRAVASRAPNALYAIFKSVCSFLVRPIIFGLYEPGRGFFFLAPAIVFTCALAFSISFVTASSSWVQCSRDQMGAKRAEVTQLERVG